MRILFALALALAASPALSEPAICDGVPCDSITAGAGWVQGERLPIMTPWQVIPSWKDLKLPKPAKTERYIRVQDDILLQEVSTGVILKLTGRYGY